MKMSNCDVPDALGLRDEKASKKVPRISDGKVGQYDDATLDFFKSAITSQVKLFVRGRNRKPRTVILGQNQLEMLRQDSVARWMLESLTVEESREKSKLQFK